MVILNNGLILQWLHYVIPSAKQSTVRFPILFNFNPLVACYCVRNSTITNTVPAGIYTWTNTDMITYSRFGDTYRKIEGDYLIIGY